MLFFTCRSYRDFIGFYWGLGIWGSWALWVAADLVGLWGASSATPPEILCLLPNMGS